MLRKIKLYGELAKFLGQKTFEAEVYSAAQAIRFLVVNFPQLESHMADRYYKVLINDWQLEEKELHYPNGQEDIKIIPIVGGAGGNTGRIILGGFFDYLQTEGDSSGNNIFKNVMLQFRSMTTDKGLMWDGKRFSPSMSMQLRRRISSAKEDVMISYEEEAAYKRGASKPEKIKFINIFHYKSFLWI